MKIQYLSNNSSEHPYQLQVLATENRLPKELESLEGSVQKHKPNTWGLQYGYRNMPNIT